MELNEGIYNHLFEPVFSSLRGFRESDYSLLSETLKDINKEYVIFDLLEINKRIQPLELIIKSISNKLIGELIINIHNKEGLVLGKIRFFNFMFKKVENLIDFTLDTESKTKNIKVSYECDKIYYLNKDGKEEEL